MWDDSEASVTRTSDAGSGDSGAAAGRVSEAGGAGTATRRRRGRITLIALLLLFSSPIALSYYTYYIVRPDGRTNYGALLEQTPVDAIGGQPVRGAVATLGELHGHWIMLVAAPSACNESCREQLVQIRQIRLMTGKERTRIERVWLLTDEGRPDPELLAQHEGLLVIRASASDVGQHLPATETTSVADHIWLVDPLGHLMMRFPPDADPSRVKKDVAKVLRASQVG